MHDHNLVVAQKLDTGESHAANADRACFQPWIEVVSIELHHQVIQTISVDVLFIGLQLTAAGGDFGAGHLDGGRIDQGCIELDG